MLAAEVATRGDRALGASYARINDLVRSWTTSARERATAGTLASSLRLSMASEATGRSLQGSRTCNDPSAGLQARSNVVRNPGSSDPGFGPEPGRHQLILIPTPGEDHAGIMLGYLRISWLSSARAERYLGRQYDPVMRRCNAPCPFAPLWRRLELTTTTSRYCLSLSSSRPRA